MMRKYLCQFYSLLASYPVIILLIAGVSFLVYLGQQYKPVEAQQRAELEQNVRLKQERQTLNKQLTGLEQADLEKRYILFNQNFITRKALNEDQLLEKFDETFKAHEWDLTSVTISPLEDVVEPNTNTISQAPKLSGIKVSLSAENTNSNSIDEPFLPLHSLIQCLKFMWSRPPIKEYQAVKITRTEDGYALELDAFLPVQDPFTLGNLEQPPL